MVTIETLSLSGTVYQWQIGEYERGFMVTNK